MVVIIGCCVVVGAVLAGFTWAGGHVHALIHPSEVLTIGGASLGALIVMSPTSVLRDLAKGILSAIKGSPYDKTLYRELLKLSYHLLVLARRDGLLALDGHVNDPHHSDVIRKYPRMAADHHAVEFLCGGLSPIIDGTTKPEQVPALLDAELKVMEEEHHAPIGVLSKTADALPGFGIVAAVLGIVITMGAIDGPVEEIGHKVGAALVGTFLGILVSYGFVAPLVSRMEFLGAAELAFFRTIGGIVMSFANECTPKVAIEMAYRGIARDCRPDRADLERIFKEVESE